jgi:hypothetical protein
VKAAVTVTGYFDGQLAKFAFEGFIAFAIAGMPVALVTTSCLS